MFKDPGTPRVFFITKVLYLGHMKNVIYMLIIGAFVLLLAVDTHSDVGVEHDKVTGEILVQGDNGLVISSFAIVPEPVVLLAEGETPELGTVDETKSVSISRNGKARSPPDLHFSPST